MSGLVCIGCNGTGKAWNGGGYGAYLSCPVHATRNGQPLGAWELVDRESFDEAFEVLPPAKMWRGGFLLGEQASTTPAGASVWWAYVEKAGKFHRALVTVQGLNGYLATVPA